jgi:mRNA interferase RelE/StbE
MRYIVEISARARKQIKRLQKGDKKKVLDKIESPGEDPRPFGYKKLIYHTDFYRVRVGNFRVIYTIEDQRLVVAVVEVVDRRNAY